MKLFQVADLNAQGEVRAQQAYDYETLERLPGCAGMIASCSGELYRQPQGFELTLMNGREPVTIRWVGSSRVDLQACKLEYSIVSPK